MRRWNHPTIPMPSPDTPTARALIAAARAELLAAPRRPAAREATLLLGHLLGWSEAQVVARDETVLAPEQVEAYRRLIARRVAGEPVAYLLGAREFFGRRFAVDDRVLIPRPETEHLVEAVLELPLPAAPRVLDIGTGSGCLAVTLALELPASQVFASDVSTGALALAHANAARLAPGRVRFAAADLDTAIAIEGFDLVVSNPPYIGREEAGDLSPEVVAFEPWSALFSPQESDTILRRLLAAALRLRAGAFIALELGFGQAPGLVEAVAPGLLIRELRRDYAGIPRVMVLERR